MNKEKAYLILQSGICILLAVLLAIGAVGIYRDGTARQKEDPLSPVYTAEEVAEKLAAVAPLFFFSLGLLAAGLILGIRDPKAEKPVKAAGRIEQKAEPKRKSLIQAVLLVVAAALIVAGILNGSARDMLIKAINICTECVGLG